MPIPLLVGALSMGGKLLGNIFGAKGRERRAARRAKRAASGKKGFLGGLIQNIFKKRRNKGQRIIESSTRLLEKRAKQDAELRAKLEKKAAKSGATSLQAYLAGIRDTSADLPAKAAISTPKGFFSNLFGIRPPQSFQLPPAMTAELQDNFQVEPSLVNFGQSKGFKLDTKTMVMIGLGVIGLVIAMGKRK